MDSTILLAKIESLIVNPDCPTLKTIENGIGLLTSPNYPENYDNDANCAWIIKAPEGSQIFLKFHAFEVQINFHQHISSKFLLAFVNLN